MNGTPAVSPPPRSNPPPAARPVKPMVVVVTGLSGAGKSQALHALEDLGFFCIDNLPTLLAPEAISLCERGGMLRIALGMDVRVREFLGEVGQLLSNLEDGGRRDVDVLFLDASDETILRRFNETRRPHPVAGQANSPGALHGSDGGAFAVLDGIRLERERLAPLRARATRTIDTTLLSVHELRRVLVTHFGPASGGTARMVTRFVSFGFKYGPPVDADVVLDVRFLDNPYFVAHLRAQSGLDAPVAAYVLGNEEAVEFMARTKSLLEFVMPRFEREGKSYLTVAIGCTGGRHRSVAIAEALARDLSAAIKLPIGILHRDLQRAVAAPPTHSVPPSREQTDDEHTANYELKGAANTVPPPVQLPAGGSR